MSLYMYTDDLIDWDDEIDKNNLEINSIIKLSYYISTVIIITIILIIINI